MELGLWEEYCELTDTNVYAFNEGLMAGDIELEAPKEITKALIAHHQSLEKEQED